MRRTLVVGMVLWQACAGGGPEPAPMGAAAEAVDVPPEVPVFGVPHGHFDAAFDLSLTSSAGAAIRYTLDGRTPGPTVGTLYTAPIRVTTTTVVRAVAYTSGTNASATRTQTYVRRADVLRQDSVPDPGWPSTFAATDDTGPYPADYEMDPEILGHPDHAGKVAPSLAAIPTVSLVSDLANWWDPEIGVYWNSVLKGDLWERPLSIEWIDPAGGPGFTENAGVRIHGQGWRGTLKPPVLSQLGGTVPSGYTLTIGNGANGGAGTIYYTTDGSDPRLPGGGVSPSAANGGDLAQVAIVGVTTVRARVLAGSTWSPLEDRAFVPSQPLENLVVNELHYNPTAPSGAQDYEFLELTNVGTSTLKLDGVAFTGGITFAFPAGATIAPGAYLVLSPNAAAFQARYGLAPDGVYAGGLSNGGETIALADGTGRVIDGVSYLDLAPWPTSPDGTGPSLSLVDPRLDNAAAASWAPSTEANGTPRARNFAVDLGDAPAVAITEPASGAEVPVGEAVLLAATASDADGAVEQVEFRADGEPIAGCVDTGAPYLCNWTPAAPGAHALTAVARDSAGLHTTSAAVSARAVELETCVGDGTGAFVECDGLVSMEAESYSARVARSSHDWQPTVTTEGYSGASAMVAAPNSGASIGTNVPTTSPELAFRVSFTRGGTYRVWIRGVGPTASDDSVYVGQGGAVTATVGLELPPWSWRSGGTLTIPTSGEHTVQLWMREDGAVIDKIVLTQDPYLEPYGKGPAESPRSLGGGGANQPPTVALTAPAAGATLSAGVAVTLEATASDADGSVAQVEFLAGGAVIPGCADATEPYSCQWTPDATGAITLAARATDELGASTTSAGVEVSVGAGGGGTGAFLESGGQVVMEAEHRHAVIDRSAHTWSPVTSPPGFAGAGAMIAAPNSGLTIGLNAPTTSPEMTFDVRFSTPGSYALWVRAYGASGSDDSLHAGVDGAVLGSKAVGGAVWVWGKVGTVTVSSAGIRTINVWMREDGTIVDRILLTTSAATPSGTGPGESPREGGASDPINEAPAVSLSAPSAGASFTVGDTVALAATADDPDGVVAQVEFLADGVVIGGCVDAEAPFGCAWVPGAEGTVTLTARATDDLGATTTSAAVEVTIAAAGGGGGGSGTFLESGGQVVMEAESFVGAVARSGHAWAPVTAPAGFAGPGAMMAAPNTGLTIGADVATTSPELTFPVEFATPGRYYLWLRGTAATKSDDSAYAGVDGVVLGSRAVPVGSWGWARVGTVDVSASGVRTIQLWMREDGAVVDRVLLTTTRTTPSGAGPAESPRVP